jgi:ABC-2 type transport system permease protein
VTVVDPSSQAGTGTLLRFALRRDRIRLAVWVAVGAALMAQQSLGSQAFYDTPEALAAYRASVGSNAATIALSGPPVGLGTVAGAVAFEISFTLVLVAALMAMTTTIRHTRADEEAGRTELVRAARVGRHAPLLAGVGLAALGCAALAVAIGAAGVATGLPAGGSFLLGASVGAAGLVFAAVAAVAAQVSGSARAGYGIVLAVFGVAFAVRAVGDIRDNGLSWLSPIGWAQATHPFSDDRWWPLLLCLAGAGVLLTGARALLDRRDLGSGVVSPRPGAASASRTLGSPWGLAGRLHRGALLGWAVGLVALGAVYGSIAGSVQTLLGNNPAAETFLPDLSTAGLVDAYLGVTLGMVVLITGAYAVSAALRARSEEAAGRAEPVLATATSRPAWLGSHAAVALLGSTAVLLAAGVAMGVSAAAATGDAALTGRVLGATLAHLPDVWVFAAVATLLVGVLPRAAAAAAWGWVAYVVVVTLFARSLDWPAWVDDLSPLSWTPAGPGEPWATGPAAALAVVALALLVTGLAGFRRRDLVPG